jgi:hypothetical protein
MDIGFPDTCSTVQLLLTGRVTHRGEFVLQRCEPKGFVTMGEPTRSRTTEQPTNSKSFECRFNVAGTQEISRCAAENPRTLHLPGCRKFSARSFSIDARGPGSLGATHPRSGIVLRHCANFEGLSHDHLRCAVREDEQNSRLIAGSGLQISEEKPTCGY